jgi:hypothetical protein
LDSPVETRNCDAPAKPVLRTSAAARWVALVVFIGCTALLVVAAWLKPDPHGYGTHEQLGSAPCGMLILTGYPCPTCGMTTSFAHFVRLQWFQSFLVQPAGFILALTTAVFAILAVRTVIVGRWPRRFLPVISSYWIFLILLIVLLGGWGFKLVYGLLTGTLPLH